MGREFEVQGGGARETAIYTHIPVRGYIMRRSHTTGAATTHRAQPCHHREVGRTDVRGKGAGNEMYAAVDGGKWLLRDKPVSTCITARLRKVQATTTRRARPHPCRDLPDPRCAGKEAGTEMYEAMRVGKTAHTVTYLFPCTS